MTVPNLTPRYPLDLPSTSKTQWPNISSRNAKKKKPLRSPKSLSRRRNIRTRLRRNDGLAKRGRRRKKPRSYLESQKGRGVSKICWHLLEAEMEMWTPVDPNGFVHEVVHQYEGGPVDHLSAVEVRARRAIVLIPDQDLLGITKCGVRRDLTRGTEETTTGHPDGIQDQGGMAGITIEHLGYPHTMHSHVIDML